MVEQASRKAGEGVRDRAENQANHASGVRTLLVEGILGKTDYGPNYSIVNHVRWRPYPRSPASKVVCTSYCPRCALSNRINYVLSLLATTEP